MPPVILLTSFTTWLPHQTSNSSDDLVGMIAQQPPSDCNTIFLRKLPVDSFQASQQVINAISTHHPDIIICCGMAESRRQLSIEACAYDLTTNVDLQSLLPRLTCTYISHHAGKFVCEDLYYTVLLYLQKTHLDIPSIFVHVPILTADNTAQIVQECYRIISTLVNVRIDKTFPLFP